MEVDVARRAGRVLGVVPRVLAPLCFYVPMSASVGVFSDLPECVLDVLIPWRFGLESCPSRSALYTRRTRPGARLLAFCRPRRRWCVLLGATRPREGTQCAYGYNLLCAPLRSAPSAARISHRTTRWWEMNTHH